MKYVINPKVLHVQQISSHTLSVEHSLISFVQVIATYTQQSETSPSKTTSEQMSTSYEEGARSFPHIPEDDTEKDAPRSSPKRFSARSTTGAQKVGQEHMFHQKVSSRVCCLSMW